MTIYRLPSSIRAILFDIDGTLYSNPAYVRFQVDVLIEELARVRGQSVQAVSAAIEKARAAIVSGRSSGGATTSLGNAMLALGIDIATSVEWRRRLIDPSRFLSPDLRLQETLSMLPATLVAVTNNPRSVGEATLAALGILDAFKCVVGLDDTMKSKPAPEPYLLAARHAEVDPENCVSVGDRYDVDLAVPLELGMGALLVAGVEDVYQLPAELFPGLT